jgi:hypothetical protein
MQYGVFRCYDERWNAAVSIPALPSGDPRFEFRLWDRLFWM